MLSELFYTERAHVRMLKVLDKVFYQKLNLDNILPPADIKYIFTNLEEIIQLHGMLFFLLFFLQTHIYINNPTHMSHGICSFKFK